jgi:hypothetical protein
MAERKTIPLRLTPKMYDEVSRWAEDEFRSVNGQIEFILREALVRHGRLKREPEGEGGEKNGEAD